jgi:hypothetical protein
VLTYCAGMFLCWCCVWQQYVSGVQRGRACYCYTLLAQTLVVIAENLPIMSGELTKFASYTFTEFDDVSRKPIIFTQSLIKRLIGLPEETVTISGTQPILRTRSLPPLNDMGNYIWHIPPNHCFLKGDSVGIDSCVWGPIPINHIRGVVAFKLTKKTLETNS